MENGILNCSERSGPNVHLGKCKSTNTTLTMMIETPVFRLLTFAIDLRMSFPSRTIFVNRFRISSASPNNINPENSTQMSKSQTLQSISRQFNKSNPRSPLYPAQLLRRISTNPAMSDLNPQDQNASSKPSGEPVSIEPQLALPEVSSGNKIDMSSGSGTFKFDALGPVVVNTDGTVSRIMNWDRMAEVEQKATMRIIGKRNKERLERLKAAEEGGAEEK